MVTITVPVVRTEGETTDPQRADAILSAALGTGIRCNGIGAGRPLRYARTEVGVVSFDDIALPMDDYRWEANALGKLCILHVAHGRVARETSAVSGRYGVGDVLLLSQPGMPYCGSAYQVHGQVTMLDLPVLAQAASSVPAGPPA